MKVFFKYICILSLTLYSHSSFTMMHKATQVLARSREAATRYIQRIPSIYHAIVKNAEPKLQTAQEHLIHIKQNTGKYITSASRIARTIISSTCSNTASYLKKNPQILYATGTGIAALCALKLIRTPLGRHTTHTVKESCINACLHSGNLTLIKYALKIAPDKINHTNQFGKTILHQAAEHNRLDIVEFLLNNYTDTINISALDHAQYEPIHYAAAYGSTALIKCFIQKGKDINAPTEQGLTPLHIAASCGRLDMAHYLVQHGTNIHATTKISGKKALDLAAQNGHYGIARYLSQLMDENKNGHYEQLLDTAINTGNYSDAYVALDGEASMVRPNLEDTPLFRCIGEYNARRATALDTIAKLLIERGAPLHYIDDAGKNTLLERTLEQGNVRIAKLLFQHDIDASEEQRTRYAQLCEQAALAPTR
jgi:ankyrin repeat protein